MLTSENTITAVLPDTRVRVTIGATTTHYPAGLCGRRFDRCNQAHQGASCVRESGHDGACSWFEVRP